MTIKHPGRVRKGRFVPDDATMFIADFMRDEGRRVVVTKTPERRDRTLSQNAYYRGVVIKVISQWADHDPDEIHEAMRYKFLGTRETKTGLRIVGRTSRLTTAEFTEYVERVRQWAAEQGLVIPDPQKVAL